MLELGWVVAVVAIGLAAWSFVRLRAERAALAGVRAAKAEADAEIDRLHAMQARLVQVAGHAAIGSLAAEIGAELAGPLADATGNVEVVAGRLEDYRGLVKAYDAAVQYCLQPVEMMFGADKASLDRLVSHVEDARRKLFEARLALDRSSALSESRTLLGDTATELRRVNALADGLDGFAVRETGAGPVDVEQVIDGALAVLGPRISEGISIVRERGELPRIRCAPGQLQQAVLGLLSNALESIDGSGRISIGSSANARQIEISIADTGHGIDEDTLPHIFDAFFTTRAAGGHSGAGLAIVHDIVKRHGGVIKVRSQPGSGTVFTVTLPIDGQAAAKPAPAIG